MSSPSSESTDCTLGGGEGGRSAVCSICAITLRCSRRRASISSIFWAISSTSFSREVILSRICSTRSGGGSRACTGGGSSAALSSRPRTTSSTLTTGVMVAMGFLSSSCSSSGTSGLRFHTETREARKFRGSVVTFSAALYSVLVSSVHESSASPFSLPKRVLPTRFMPSYACLAASVALSLTMFPTKRPTAPVVLAARFTRVPNPMLFTSSPPASRRACSARCICVSLTCSAIRNCVSLLNNILLMSVDIASNRRTRFCKPCSMACSFCSSAAIFSTSPLDSVLSLLSLEVCLVRVASTRRTAFSRTLSRAIASFIAVLAASATELLL
mmetsp:Transcript_18838/g.41247  ORF Transcript_18838/g.41247 Transcript_18838/m.41247 type:complete len:329 (-) Transcript_18838:1386-2372(-)